MQLSATIWTSFDRLREELGAEELLDSLARAMGTDELEENLKYIARMYDINLNEEEEEEE